MRTLFATGIAILLFSLLAAPVVYASPEAGARLNYLAQSLRAQETNAEYWEYGWGAFDGGTMLWSAVQASRDQDRKDRNTDIVQAAESLAGLADVILRPLPAFNADSACTEPADTQCLAAREAMLERSAQRADDPYEILPHLENFGFNLLAGLIVWRVADNHNALTTAIPGEIIGEIQLWTIPRQPKTDFDRYKLQFSPLLVQTESSHRPATGLMLTFRF